MNSRNHTKVANGRICYVEIPSADIDESASFYQKVFGWKIRKRSDGSIAFDDTSGGVSGTWKLNKPPHKESGLMVHIMVDDVSATLDAVEACGGKTVEPVSGESPEFYAKFSDPSGNIFGIAQE